MPLRDVEKSAVLLSRRWLRDLLLADWGLKLLALAITLGLWFAVTGQRTPTTMRLRRVPLFFTLPADMDISNEPLAEVELTLRGSKSALDALRASDVALTCDTSNYKAGERTVRLTAQNVALELPETVNPESIGIERIEPNSLLLKLERRIERELEVEPRLEGKLPDGYELLGARALPERIRVRGPESRVNALEKAQTETISLDGRTSSFTAPQIAVEIADRKVLALEPTVDVIVQISEAQTTQRLNGVPVRVGGDESHALARPATAAIEIRGARSALASLRAADLSLLLEPAADGTWQPRLVLPPGLEGRVTLVTTNPTTFTVNH